MSRFGVAVLALAGIVRISMADASTILQTSHSETGNEGGYAVGVQFLVNAPITVSQLGMFDSGADGFSGTLWSYLLTSTGGVKASAAFTPGAPGTLIAAYRFLPITPVSLDPGVYNLVGYGFSAADPEHNSFISGLPDTFNSGGGLVTFRYPCSA